MDALRRASRGGSAARSQARSEPGTDGRFSRPADSAWVILAVGTVLGLGLAFRFFTRSDLWADEVLSVNIAGLDVRHLLEALKHDGAPPLYYLLLHFWMRAFGTGSPAVRALSGLIGVATIVPMWFAGRRLDRRRSAAGLQSPDARTVAWAATLLLVASPFAIRYATEARMYALLILLGVLGYLAVMRSLERPSWGRLLGVAVLAALLLYTHYWAFALVAVMGGTLAWLARFGRADRRRPALLTLGALVVGGLAFIPWLPTFRYQVAHTGTPWGAPISPAGTAAAAFKSFGGNTHIVGWALLLMVLLGVFARALDGRHIEIDLATRSGVRLEAGLALATLAVGLVLARATNTTFEGRYAAVMFPLFLMAAAFGVAIFTNRTLRYALLALLLVGGFWGGVSNALRNRTQAYQVVNVLKANAAPGDLVVYCPDSIGTDVSRLLPAGVRQTSFPSLTVPGRVDWADYAERVDAVNPARFAQALLQRAGTSNSIWLVYSSGSTLTDVKCTGVADALALSRPQRERLIEPDAYFFEHQGLYKFAPG